MKTPAYFKWTPTSDPCLPDYEGDIIIVGRTVSDQRDTAMRRKDGSLILQQILTVERNSVVMVEFLTIKIMIPKHEVNRHKDFI